MAATILSSPASTMPWHWRRTKAVSYLARRPARISLKRARLLKRALLLDWKRALVVTSATRVTSTRMTSALISRSMFVRPIMTGIACVALSVPGLVCMEMFVGLLPARWVGSDVAVMRIVAVVDMAIKSVRAVIPGSSPDEYAPNEPIRPIVAIRCTVIGSKVVVAIRAHRRNPNVDGYLCRRTGKTTR